MQDQLELWTGIECSVVRIHDDYRDQLKELGHYDRLEDIDALASTGVKTIRYPVLMEHTFLDKEYPCNWERHDRALNRLREHGIEPIVGLIHHGSGPRWTCLEDPLFSGYVAHYAWLVAERYPWLRKFTPINEPLTTARFSGLYGIWYPHRENEQDFLRMLHNECQAVWLSMRAIREVIPEAELIQTEDMGRTFSTEDSKLMLLAEYYNERRWLTFDLLAGRVTPSHSWYNKFLEAGVNPSQLNAYYKNPVGAFTLGVNHYLTSDRWLDHRAELYEGWTECDFADVEAVRVKDCPPLLGFKHRLVEVAQRYPDYPLAVTECHLGHEVEEQIRWVLETWEACLQLREAGVNLRAMTLWSVFGSTDWRSLLTRRDNDYEPGVFHLIDGKLEETPLVEIARKLIEHGDYYHPVIEEPGWWKREERFFPNSPGGRD